MRIRIFILTLGTTFLYLALLFNIYQLQIQKGDYYSARAISQQRLSGLLQPPRGRIYFTDRNGNTIPAAIAKPHPLIFAVPKEISDPERSASLLAPIIKTDFAQLVSILSKPNDEYEVLIPKASLDQTKQIRSLGIKGIYFEEENSRFYPFNNLSANLLGFVGASASDSYPTGRYGLELYYDEELRGIEGKIDGNRLVKPIPGDDLYLTIDPNIQTRAEEILADLIKKFKAESGLVIVQEPGTGKIIALGNIPNFNPNNYQDYPLKNFLNPVIQSIYEPGSVMKVVTMAAGIDSGKITPETAFNDTGSLTLNGRIIKNFEEKAYGKVTMTEVIEKSINTGAAYAQRLIGNDIFYNYLVDFGFGAKTGVAFPGEVSGSISNLRSGFRDINFATASFGQGISVTSLQLINAVSAIANGGVLMKPYLTLDDKPTPVRRVVSAETAAKVTAMMTSSVKKNILAQIPKFDVAGKTGTAQIPNFKTGGYTDEVIHTYVGFAPAKNPRFTILIRIDKPKGAALAGFTVVSGFRDLAEFLLNYYNMTPDYLE